MSWGSPRRPIRRQSLRRLSSGLSRSDIHEEVARLHGHLDHLDGLLAGTDPCGRKLDFLVQEMNREINTIGSKAEGGQRDTGTLVVAVKAELEKIREQVQNVE